MNDGIHFVDSDDGPALEAVVVGDAVPDVIARLPGIPAAGGSAFGPPPTVSFGGAGANVAAALARLGTRVGFVGRVGADESGRSVRADLMACGVDTGGMVNDPERGTGTVIALVDPSGERTMLGCVLGAAYGCLAPEDLAWAPLQHAAVVHVSGLLMVEEPGCATALQAIREAAMRGIEVYYDPNLRAFGLNIPTAQCATHWEALTRAHVVTATEDELALLGACHAAVRPNTPVLVAARETARALFSASTTALRLIVIKQGRRGATALLPDGTEVSAPSYAVPLVDTIGAGDVFDAALIVARRRGDPLAAALRYANAAAALSIMRVGGRNAPTPRAIAALQESQRKAEGALADTVSMDE